jgi:hypothetical protein
MWWDRFLDPFRGKAVTIPPLDGPFKPNTALDDAPLVASVPAPIALIWSNRHLITASGSQILTIADEGVSPLASFEADVSSLASLPDGGLVAGLANGSLHFVGGVHHGKIISAIGEGRLCPTALAVLSSHFLLVAQGSRQHGPNQWAADLMGHGKTGSLWRLNLENGEQICLADGLAWAAGLTVRPDHSIILSESWRHRLIKVSHDERGRISSVLSNLPGYPGHISARPGDGAWLSLFAPRNRLVELVLREDRFRSAMLTEVPSDFWIAPALASGNSFLEPLQCGGVRVMGIHKPWSPTRSYGLTVRLNEVFQPEHSLHSRADGHRHGIVATVETENGLYAASYGGNAILRLESHR